ncbi:unnamed protein product [Mytilus coruscus]|uniref:Uncharacterized protein n=1 Tax=Mytilus coruscus TaxID=42192 RepID=A0A6J8D170_MYTCO|nr:unnamed protein product [Mytilus coruscus]
MTFFKGVIRAAFVLPFSAGNVDEENGSHDGSLSGLLLMTTSIAILSEILMIGFSTNETISTKFSVGLAVLSFLSALAIVLCVCISLYVSSRGNSVFHVLPWNKCNTIRLRFLWIFCFSCIISRTLDMTFYIDCLTNSMTLKFTVDTIVYDLVCIVFYVVQTAFITYFSHSRFTSHLGIYYGLLIIFLTNISVICHALASTFKPMDVEILNLTTTSHHTSSNTSCFKSSMYAVLMKINPFLLPAFCEYSLVSITFIMNMWPTFGLKRETFVLDDISLDGNKETSESLSNLRESTNERSESTNSRRNNELSPLLNNTGNTSNNRQHRIRRFISISVPILLNLPSVILYCLQISKVPSVQLGKTISIAVVATIELLLYVKCFYSLQTQCKPLKQRECTSLDSSDYILIASVVAAISYSTVKLMSDIYNVNSETTYAIGFYKLVIDIFAAYFQTVFILQMKQYSKAFNISSWTSVEYTCLLMSFVNLCSWAADTLIVSQYVYKNDAPYHFFGSSDWTEIFGFLYPFVIFYRFNAFVSFYGLYDRLKK